MGMVVVIVIVPGRHGPPKFGDQLIPMPPLIHSSVLASAVFVRSLSSRFVSVRVKVKLFPPPLKPNENPPLYTCSSVVLVVVVVNVDISLKFVMPKVPVPLLSATVNVPFTLPCPLVTVPVALLVTLSVLLNVPFNVSVAEIVLLSCVVREREVAVTFAVSDEPSNRCLSYALKLPDKTT